MLNASAGPNVSTSTVRSDNRAVESAIDALFEEPETGGRNTLAVLIMHKGEVVSERYAEPVGPNTRLQGWSMNKSLMASFVGVQVGKGQIALSMPVRERLTALEAPEHTTRDVSDALTLKHLMSMASGLDFDERYLPGDDVTEMLYGGVGSVAVALLAARGFSVAASTGKPDAANYLTHLGASTIIDRHTLSAAGKPLQAEQWAGVVDAVGGNTLANACAQTRYGGVVTACGLAESAALPATVMPFILRSVVLRGVDSVMAPAEPRLSAWARLARDMDLSLLETMITEISLSEVCDAAPNVLAGKIKGRLLVDVNR